MSGSLLRCSLREVSSKLRRGDISAVDLMKEVVSQTEVTSNLNAFVTTQDPKTLLAQAARVDEADKKTWRELEGIPIALKDNFQAIGTKTTCASKMLGNYISTYDSTITEGLQKHGGAIIVGKTNMDEFAMGSTSKWSHVGAVVNPWSTHSKYSPGGSSGGSAVAVACGAAFAAMGSDTGGSVRQPASHCGIAGLKPTYGELSRWGLVSFGSSLDCPGIFARDAGDVAVVLKSLVEYCHIAAASRKYDSTNYMPEGRAIELVDELEKLVKGMNEKEDLEAFLKGKVVGIPREYFVKELHPDVEILWRQTASYLESCGAELKEISLPHTAYALPVYYGLSAAEVSSNLSRYDGIRYGHSAVSKGDQSVNFHDAVELSRTSAFGFEVQRRILLGMFCLSQRSYDEYHKKSLQVRRLIREDFSSVFDSNSRYHPTSSLKKPEGKVDIILTPTSQLTQPEFETIEETVRKSRGNKRRSVIEEYVNDVMMMPASLAGLPALSTPVGITKEGLPVGMQLIGSWYDEATLLHIGQAIHNHMKPPPCPHLSST